MSGKNFFIFTLGIFLLVGIFSSYFLHSSAILKPQTIEKAHAQLPESSRSGDISTAQCITNSNDVKIYAYMFHYIIPDKYVSKDNKIEYGNSIPPEKLESILQILAVERANNKVTIVSMRELENFQKTACFPNKNIVLLTVDDGWDDGYNFLFPLAKKYNMKFNLGIIADKVAMVPIEINNFLDEGEIQEMLNSGLITIASHSFSHIELINKSGTVLQKEILSSKDTLEKLFHISINTLVYPSGKYDISALREAKKAGYSFGFTTKEGIITKTDLDKNPLILPRIRVNRDINISKTFLFK